MSSVHISEDDSKLLDDDNPFISVVVYKYGWWLHVSCEETCNNAAFVEHLTDYGFSPSIGHMLSVARSHACDWIKLDADAPIYDFLEQYHW